MSAAGRVAPGGVMARPTRQPQSASAGCEMSRVIRVAVTVASRIANLRRAGERPAGRGPCSVRNTAEPWQSPVGIRLLGRSRRASAIIGGRPRLKLPAWGSWEGRVWACGTIPRPGQQRPHARLLRRLTRHRAGPHGRPESRVSRGAARTAGPGSQAGTTVQLRARAAPFNDALVRAMRESSLADGAAQKVGTRPVIRWP